MKKLLYTLFAFALIVACEKDMDDNYDSSSINPIEAEVSNLDIDAIVGDLVSRWTANGISVPSTKGSVSTARNTGTACAEDTRDGQTIDGETDYISYEIAIINGRNFGIARSDADSPLAAFTPLVTVYFVNKGSNNVNIVVNGSVVNSFNNAQFIPLFANGAPLNGGYVENLNAAFIYLTPGTLADAGVACTAAAPASWGESSTTPGLFELAGVGSYTIAPAPFPLTGFLATMSTNDTSHTVSNYAGTTSSSVHDEIRGDYAGN